MTTPTPRRRADNPLSTYIHVRLTPELKGEVCQWGAGRELADAAAARQLIRYGLAYDRLCEALHRAGIDADAMLSGLSEAADGTLR